MGDCHYPFGQKSSLVHDVDPGVIVQWSGAVGTIPGGFALCDGNNGTPDLRDKFVIGAGDTYAPGDTGGAVNHDHTLDINAHGHTIPGGIDINTGTGVSSTSNTTIATGTTDTKSNLPPYYALAYIMAL